MIRSSDANLYDPTETHHTITLQDIEQKLLHHIFSYEPFVDIPEISLSIFPA